MSWGRARCAAQEKSRPGRKVEDGAWENLAEGGAEEEPPAEEVREASEPWEAGRFRKSVGDVVMC